MWFGAARGGDGIERITNHMDDNYKPIGIASQMTGLSEIKLHQLRIAGIVHTRITRDGKGEYVALYNVNDILGWMGNTTES